MEDYKGYKYTIEQDCDVGSPREDDNLGVMVCQGHRHYDLGDSEASKNFPFDDFESWDEAEAYLKKEYDAVVILPLYVYEHGGITMNTTGFSCRWDIGEHMKTYHFCDICNCRFESMSGQVGFIYATREEMLKWWGKKRLSKKLLEQTEKALQYEVKLYDYYITGDVWWYKIEDISGEEVDSCGGWYGYEEVEKEVKGIIDRLAVTNSRVFIGEAA